MAGNITEKAGSAVTTVSSGGSVSNAAASIANGASNLTNSTGLCNSTIARLTAAAGSVPAEGATVSLYLVPKADGTNIAGVDTSTPYLSPNYLVGFFYWPAASSASSQIMDITGIPLEAYDYAPYIINNLGQSISSGWSLVFYPTTGQYT